MSKIHRQNCQNTAGEPNGYTTIDARKQQARTPLNLFVQSIMRSNAGLNKRGQRRRRGRLKNCEYGNFETRCAVCLAEAIGELRWRRSHELLKKDNHVRLRCFVKPSLRVHVHLCKASPARQIKQREDVAHAWRQAPGGEVCDAAASTIMFSDGDKLKRKMQKNLRWHR